MKYVLGISICVSIFFLLSLGVSSAASITPLYGSDMDAFKQTCPSDIVFGHEGSVEIERDDDNLTIQDIVLQNTGRQKDIAEKSITLTYVGSETGMMMGETRFRFETDTLGSVIFSLSGTNTGTTKEVKINESSGCGRDLIGPRITQVLDRQVGLHESIQFLVTDKEQGVDRESVTVTTSGADATRSQSGDTVVLQLSGAMYDMQVGVIISASDGTNTSTKDFIAKTVHSPQFCAMKGCPVPTVEMKLTTRQCEDFSSVLSEEQAAIVESLGCEALVQEEKPRYQWLAIIGWVLFGFSLIIKLSYLKKIRTLKKHLFLDAF